MKMKKKGLYDDCGNIIFHENLDEPTTENGKNPLIYRGEHHFERERNFGKTNDDELDPNFDGNEIFSNN